jgi:purine-binding chemotaxis protein CheW
MVDLVKIRKKKAEKKKAEPDVIPSVSEGPGREAAEQSAPEAPAAVPPPELQLPRSARDDMSKLEKFKQTAGTKRENKIAQETAQTAQQLELLTFVIAHEHYAVDIERIVEIVTPRAVTRIPNADLSIVGIMSLRGTIVTIVDVRRKLRHPPAGEPDADTRIVVIDNKNEMIGFVVDRVLRVVKAAADEIEPHPVVHSAELDEAVRGVFRAGDALTILLDLDKLLVSAF